MKKDLIYTNSPATPGEFKFDQQVAEVFTDMIHRSVPGYEMMLDMIGIITRRYVKPETNCYDLGCSLGASTLYIRHNLPDGSCHVIAVDNAPAMIEQCRKNITADKATGKVDCYCQDVFDTKINNASLVVMNLTLQFIQPDTRMELLNKIYTGLNPGGVLVLSEKIKMPDDNSDQLLIELHHEFKYSQGYSDMEISGKRDALENVLVPETLTDHRQRLAGAGFTQVTPWFQCFNFISLLALK